MFAKLIVTINFATNKVQLTSFVRSGNFNPDNGKSWGAGANGYGWSSRGSDTRYDGATMSSVYYLNFNAARVSPSAGPDARWFAFPLRCLSTVLDI